MFTTAEDGQRSVEIHVLQGEREMADSNRSLGKFELVDLPPAPRGVPQIEVVFDIDADGIVHVSAKDRSTGKEQSMTITGQSSLTDAEIEQMVKDAEANAEADKQRARDAELRNEADGLVYRVERFLRDNPTETGSRAKVQHDLAAVKEALKAGDMAAVRVNLDELRASFGNIGAEIYTSNQTVSNEDGSGDGAEFDAEDGEIIDGEVVEES